MLANIIYVGSDLLKDLSNLDPTAVNRSLVPGSGGVIDLGEDATRFRYGYFSGLFATDTFTTASDIVASDFIDSTHNVSISKLAQNSQMTGVLTGGSVSVASSTQLNIAAGSGRVTRFLDPENPDTTEVTWAALTNYTPVNINTSGQYVLGFDSNGDLHEFSAATITTASLKQYIFIGAFACHSGALTALINTPFNVAANGASTARDFIRDVIGPSNVTGNVISANGANLSVNSNGGTIFIPGSNYRVDSESPDEPVIAAASPVTFVKLYREAAPSTRLLRDGGSVTVIDPTKYDDGSGTLQTLTPNSWTVQTLYIDHAGQYWVMYGQETFSKKSEAENAVVSGSLSLTEYPTIQRFVRRCFIVVNSSATDLSNDTEATFIEDGKFRGGGATYSGETPGIHSPGGLDGYIQFNDNGIFGGDSSLFWDETNSRLGIGTDAPTDRLHVVGDSKFNGSVNIDTTTGALTVPRMTTTERNSISAVDGMVIYNTTTSQFEKRQAGSWQTL